MIKSIAAIKYLLDHLEDTSPMTWQGTKIADLICLVIGFRFLLNLLEKGIELIQIVFSCSDKIVSQAVHWGQYAE